MTRFRFVRQQDSMECGVACLKMICQYYGNYTDMKTLNEVCCPTTEGVSLLGINHAAQKIGFTTFIGKVGLDSLCQENLPAILHWNQNHFVVLYKVKNQSKFYIADPAKGIVICDINEMRKYWLISESKGDNNIGIAMFLEPNDNFQTTQYSGNRIKSFGFLWGYIKHYQKYFIQIVAGLVVGCVLQLILPFLTQSIVDIGIKNNNIGFIWLVLLGELMIVIGRTATDFIRRWLLLHISMRINISLVSDFFIKLLKLPMSFFDTKLMGDLLQRIGDHSRVQTFLTNQLLSVVFTFFSFVIFGIVLYIYNWMIFTVFLIGSLIYGGWISIFLRKRKILDYELFEQQAKNQNKTYQFITSMQEIKLQDCEQRRRWEWEDTQADLFNVKMKTLKIQQSQEAGSIFINEVKNIIITVFAATSVINGQMTLGAMLAIQYIIGQLNSPIEQLMSFIYSLQDVKISLERISEVHNGKNEETKETQLDSFISTKTIEIKNVDFKYDYHSIDKILEDVSFNVPAGKVTAIVGASGSGKTTLIKLMLGYYPVLSGSILVAGKNINEYNLKWWRRHCGVVMQEGVIFSESIARNIAIDDGEIDVKRLEEAAKIANIHNYIIGLPLKYNTIIGRDGIGLSQGQKQRILIARAVYKHPDFIFFDEATNALDAKNERDIVENLDEFFTGRTVIVVAHRLSTVKNADQIIVIDKGRIVEIGNHASLIKEKGYYYNLVKNQLELGS